jgi:hypothetical protein
MSRFNHEATNPSSSFSPWPTRLDNTETKRIYENRIRQISINASNAEQFLTNLVSCLTTINIPEVEAYLNEVEPDTNSHTRKELFELALNEIRYDNTTRCITLSYLQSGETPFITGEISGIERKKEKGLYILITLHMNGQSTEYMKARKQEISQISPKFLIKTMDEFINVAKTLLRVQEKCPEHLLQANEFQEILINNDVANVVDNPII